MTNTRVSRLLDGLFRFAGRAVLAVFLCFLILPALFIAVLSFASDPHIAFPPRQWGLDRYVEVFTSDTWLRPIGLSLTIAAATAAVTLLVAVPAMFALKRGKVPGGGVVESAAIAPMLFPVAAYAVGMYGVFAQFRLIGTFGGIVIAHAITAIPLVVILLSTAMDQIRPELELAAMTMGAARVRAWAGITARLLLPAILAAAIFAFILSFDEAVFITFLGGPGLVTLPKYIFDSVQFGVDPAITAVATLLMVVTAALMSGATVLRGRGR
ncbi:ABC transporter permease [Microbispora sp. CA-102843]|uniref:ABC transporter permease n=1 Tax=Microbispora sp. CA-102843 TaxID=3239952 RepID=UPI003D91DEA5